MKIFISYRRDDSAGYAGRLFDHLTKHFGSRNVFMDIDTIEPGEDFRNVVQNAVSKCDVVLVMIGKQWLNITDPQGKRRLDDPLDWVRVEIASALANPKVRVIPVLVRDVSMPGTHDLPQDLKELSWRNATELSDNRFQYDANELIKVIERAGVSPAPTTPTQSQADDFFREATRLNLMGQAERALQFYRRVKQIDPYYPDIDLVINNIEREREMGLINRQGSVQMDQALKKEEAPIEAARIARTSAIIVAIITLIGVLFTAYLTYSKNQSQSVRKEYIGRILDANTLRPIANAKITLDLEGVSPVIYSDSEGTYRFKVAIKSPVSGQIRVDAPGYQVYTRNITISPEFTTMEDIRLTP
jgi:hypothetical protein